MCVICPKLNIIHVISLIIHTEKNKKNSTRKIHIVLIQLESNKDCVVMLNSKSVTKVILNKILRIITDSVAAKVEFNSLHSSLPVSDFLSNFPYGDQNSDNKIA